MKWMNRWKEEDRKAVEKLWGREKLQHPLAFQKDVFNCTPPYLAHGYFKCLKILGRRKNRGWQVIIGPIRFWDQCAGELLPNLHSTWHHQRAQQLQISPESSCCWSELHIHHVVVEERGDRKVVSKHKIPYGCFQTALPKPKDPKLQPSCP